MNKNRDIAYGRHSLVPECCIQFFVDEWEYEMQLNTPYYRAAREANYGYVPCPECLGRNNKVAIRCCKIACGKECWKEF